MDIKSLKQQTVNLTNKIIRYDASYECKIKYIKLNFSYTTPISNIEEFNNFKSYIKCMLQSIRPEYEPIEFKDGAEIDFSKTTDIQKIKYWLSLLFIEELIEYYFTKNKKITILTRDTWKKTIKIITSADEKVFNDNMNKNREFVFNFIESTYYLKYVEYVLLRLLFLKVLLAVDHNIVGKIDTIKDDNSLQLIFKWLKYS
jgi:hypothetical protein